MRPMPKLFCITACIFIFSSCNIINPEEPIPSYIEINSIHVKTNGTGSEGSITYQISDAWVFLDNNNRGVWELPAKIPLLGEGSHNLKILAGIKTDGIEELRTAYPFWDFYTNDTSFNLTPTQVLTVNPVVEYYTSTNFVWVEDFEGAGISLDSTGTSTTSIAVTHESDNVRSGKGSGQVVLDETNTFFKSINKEVFSLPTGAKPVYLELDYKTTIDFSVFVVSHNPLALTESTIIGIKPRLDENGNSIWNKIYIELTPEISSNFEASGYQIGIATSLPSDQTYGTLILDNIKLIHS